MQVYPIKLTLKTPGSERLNEDLLSNFGFKFNLRRYNLDKTIYVKNLAYRADEAGAYPRPLFSST